MFRKLLRIQVRIIRKHPIFSTYMAFAKGLVFGALLYWLWDIYFNLAIYQ